MFLFHPALAFLYPPMNCLPPPKAAFMVEVNEMRRDPVGYFHDRWNVLDLLAIVLMCAGWLLRVTEGESQWTKGLYALSAPLIFARVLYFAEFLPFQGPMIQVSFDRHSTLDIVLCSPTKLCLAFLSSSTFQDVPIHSVQVPSLLVALRLYPNVSLQANICTLECWDH